MTDQQSATPMRTFNSARSLFLLAVKATGISVAAFIVAMFLGWADFGWFSALIALMAFSLIGPVYVYRGRSFWLGGLVAVGIWMGMFLILTGVADAMDPGEEAAMILLLPMMVFPVGMGLVGLASFVRWLGREGSPVEDSPSPAKPAPSPPNPPLEGEG